MLEIFAIIKNKESGKVYKLMETFMRENGSIIRSTVMEYLSILKVKDMKVSF